MEVLVEFLTALRGPDWHRHEPTLEACLRSWPPDPWMLAALLVTAGIYLRGWWVLRARDGRRWHSGHPVAFAGALATIYLALASPIEPLSGLLLAVHMVQHLLLMMLAPPRCGWPLRCCRCFADSPSRTRLLGWSAAAIALCAPADARYCASARGTAGVCGRDLVLAHPRGLRVRIAIELLALLPHVCFLAAALLFWYPVVRPYPGRRAGRAGYWCRI